MYGILINSMYMYIHIELLHRFKLWSTASAVMNHCRLDEISSINQVDKRSGLVNYSMLDITQLLLCFY